MMRVRRSTGARSLGTLAALLLFFLSFVASAETGDADGPSFYEFQTRHAGIDCEEQWSTMWQLFRDGDPYAATYLGFGVFFPGLIPPGATGDRISQRRHLFVLLAYGAGSDDPEWNFLFESLRPAGERHYRCIVDGVQTPESCLADAIEAGYLPSIESYEREIETLRDARGLPARCDSRLSFHPHIAYPQSE